MNEIILSHRNFVGGTSKECSGDTIIASSVRADDERFTSELTVNVSSEFNNRTVRCTLNSDMGMIPIGEQTISVISGEKD